MLSRFFSKHAAWTQVILRVSLGAILVAHGYGKLFGTGGVPGVAGFFGNLGIPLPLIFAWLVTLLELAGGIALILGFFVRYVSAALVIQFAYIVLASIFTGRPKSGFLGGWEYDLLLMVVALVLVLLGSGRKLSLEHVLFKKEF